MPPDVQVALVTPGDIEQAISLLQELRVSFGGIEGRALYRALCSSKSVLAVAAHVEGRLAGITITELDRNWIYKHPILAARMLRRRLSPHLHTVPAIAPVQHTPAISGFVRDSACPVPWSAREPRIVFIGVEAGNRGRGLGSALYRETFRELEGRGRTNLLARIDSGNIASILLHAHTGWEIYLDGGVITALKRLNPVR